MKPTEKGEKADNGLEFRAGAVLNNVEGVFLLRNLCLGVEGQASYNFELLGLIAAFFPSHAAVSALDILVLPLIFIDGDAGGARFEEGHGNKEVYGHLLIVDGFVNDD